MLGDGPERSLATAILLFPEVEVLDFAGPFEVFSVTGREAKRPPFRVYTVAERAEPVLARNGLSVNPGFSIRDCPRPDVLVIPGGFGTRREMHNELLLMWIRDVAATAQYVLSVCTGALLLGRAGLLDGLEATTHHGALELLRHVAPATQVRDGVRVVDNGRVILSAGISAGIDMALYTVGRIYGVECARETARYMEYDWREEIGPVVP